MTPANQAINAADMDKLWPGNDYAEKLNKMGKSFFQQPETAWRSVAAWYKLTNRVIKNCGLDLFTQPYETQTRCILEYAIDRSENQKVANMCFTTVPARKTAITSAFANYCGVLCPAGKI